MAQISISAVTLRTPDKKTSLIAQGFCLKCAISGWTLTRKSFMIRRHTEMAFKFADTPLGSPSVGVCNNLTLSTPSAELDGCADTAIDD